MVPPPGLTRALSVCVCVRMRLCVCIEGEGGSGGGAVSRFSSVFARAGFAEGDTGERTRRLEWRRNNITGRRACHYASGSSSVE